MQFTLGQAYLASVALAACFLFVAYAGYLIITKGFFKW